MPKKFVLDNVESMKRHLRKPHSRKHGPRSGAGHWLEEGALGQESLLGELDPFLYAADQRISTLALSLVHRTERGTERPFAVVVPHSGTLGWQVGYLSRWYNVYVWSEQCDDLMYLAADRFGLKLVSGDILSWAEHDVNFFLFVNSVWQGEAELSEALEEAKSVLAEQGIICAVLPGHGRGHCEELVWWDGRRTQASELGNVCSIGRDLSFEMEAVRLERPDAEGGVVLNDFLKRNRDYFGRKIRDAFSDRMRENDLAQYFRGDLTDESWWSVVGSWVVRKGDFRSGNFSW